MDIIMSINMGGDDYITKPFSPQVLVAKIQAILRRTYSYNKDLKSDIIKFKDVTLNIVEGKIYFKDEKLFKMKFNKIISKGEKVMETKKGTPIVTEMQVIPVAGYDSMLMTLSGAHAPYFTRNIDILATKAGVDPELVYQAIRGGLAGSTVLDAKSNMVMDRNFKPGFRIDLHIKDLGNVLDTAHGVGAPLPLTAAVMEMMQAIKLDGCGTEDHSSLVKYYEKLANAQVVRKGN